MVVACSIDTSTQILKNENEMNWVKPKRHYLKGDITSVVFFLISLRRKQTLVGEISNC